MNTNSRYDVIIIGTGAGGGTLAHRLAHTGKKILLIERGGFLPREKENWSSDAVVLQSKYKAREAWYDKNGEEFHPGINYYVGGQTKFYGAALFRFREEDFRAIQHRDGVSPAWPLSYDDFEPYYDQAERLYHVHGERGADPTEPRTTNPFPYPALRHERRVQEVFDSLSSHGYHPFPVPLGLKLDESRPDSSLCIRCNTCDGFACLLQAKADAETIALRPALSHSNVDLLTHAKAIRLETDPTGGSVRRLIVEHEGREIALSADLFVVSCGAVNSAALLLRSVSDRHPQGLGNRSGQVGRHYMCHNNSAVLAVFPGRENHTVFQKTLAINDFYHAGRGEEYPLGHIQLMGKWDATTLRVGAPWFAPTIGLDFIARHSLDFFLTTEDLPDPNNRVMVGPKGEIHLHYTENNLESHKRLTQRFREMIATIGGEHHLLPSSLYLGKKLPIGGVAHQCGTLRFGEDPDQSVLDIHCKVHDVENLYVVDASFFPSSTAVNPALTIMANALRVGDHLCQRMGCEAAMLDDVSSGVTPTLSIVS